MKKVLLLGLGFFGSHWYEVIRNMDNCEVVGVCAMEQDIEKLRAKYGTIPTAYTDYKDAIEKCDADILLIVIPTPLHTDAARRALKKGMHVLSEKPFTDSMEDAHAMLEFKKDYPNLKYMVSQNYRWRPHTQALKNFINSGRLGKVEHILMEFRQPEDLTGYREFLQYPLIEDVSIHHFDLLRFITGSECEKMDVRTYRPAWSKYAGTPGTDAFITMKNGISVNYCATWAARGMPTSWDGAFVITGEKGCLTTDIHDCIRFFPVDGEMEIVPPAQMEYTEQVYSMNALINAIDTDTVPPCNIEDNVYSLEMVMMALEAAKNKE